ncbi:MAG: nucleotide exchange factor GrpE [Flavobacteriaceae bacterium]|nr:nucleotide exchange factor GrpE [Flavobacteriaceae bacterium]
MSKKNKKEPEEEVLTADKETLQEEKAEEVSPLEALQAELEKEKDKNLRLFAEFENFKKRTSKERIELFSTASEGVMNALLPILDDFDRALLEIEKSDNKVHLEGIALISNKLRENLKSKGLTHVETNQGDVFNADIHEAITQIPAPSKDLKGKIVDVVEKGYKLGEKVIRFPKVIIGQ